MDRDLHTMASAARPAAPILVVDDNAGKRLALRAMLTPLGHDIVEADSGRAALRAVMGQTFAVILMDILMPNLDGYETAKLIRQHDESKLTPIIFVTSYGRDETETATAYASGAVDFLFMPVPDPHRPEPPLTSSPISCARPRRWAAARTPRASRSRWTSAR